MGEHPLLFWLSLVPFVTGWMGENHFDSIPTAAYAVVMLLAGGAYLILQLRSRRSDVVRPRQAHRSGAEPLTQRSASDARRFVGAADEASPVKGGLSFGPDDWGRWAGLPQAVIVDGDPKHMRFYRHGA